MNTNDIQRYTARNLLGGVSHATPDPDGDYVTYDDHLATIATLTAERDEANELASENSRSYHFAAEMGAGWKYLAREYGKRHAQHREALDALKEAVALTESEKMADIEPDFVRVFHAAKDCIEATEVKLPIVNDQHAEQ